MTTPHIRSEHDVRIEELPSRVNVLQRKLDELGVSVRVATGGEISQLAADALSNEQLRALSLDEGGWVLLEPAPGILADELPALVERLAERGARTILAHPERHAGPDFEQRLHALVGCGCLLQWTADFIAQRSSKDPEDFVLGLARDGLVHLLSSDAHSSHGGRPLRLSAGYERLREVCSREQVDWIANQAPAAILRGDPVEPI